MEGKEDGKPEDEKALKLTRGWLVFAFSVAAAMCAAGVFICGLGVKYGRQYGELVEKTHGFEQIAEGHYTTVREDIAVIRDDINALRLEIVGLRNSVDDKLNALQNRLRQDIRSMRRDANDL